MKITVIPKEVVAQPTTVLQDLEPGTVVTLSGGSIEALVIAGARVIAGHVDRDNKLVLLTSCGGDWFAEPGGWADTPIHSVVGKLTKIVVQEI